ncbi:type VII secretion protein EccB [Streptomyces sp. HM190]|uniref:type VII secretion protein EccB n=1 Tax=Streptomyces sp. HM190 TaxID=2695266 RepID=UPI0013598620|nr:type VII secretion protein EccB [Streptomyces sp. HM190]
MASRRDQLNAYTFAKRRMLASFLQSSPDGSDEGAPRPLRAVLPGTIVGVVIVAAFGAWGMFKPTAPKDWDKPGEKVIVASESTTRYVVLETESGTGSKTQLHPVLNMASAKLLLATGKGEVVTVDESVLDKGDIPHGVTIGIPYAPDRLPSAEEAGAKKRWAVCERQGPGGRAIQKAAFVLASRDTNRTEGRNKLRGGQLLDVIDPDGTRYVVDAGGTAYELVGDDELLVRAVVGSASTPHRVSRQWLDTLHEGDPITFPKIEGRPGAPADVPGPLKDEDKKVGMVLKAKDGTEEQHYVVLPDRVAPVSAFVAELLLISRELVPVGQRAEERRVSPGQIVPGEPFGEDRDWPTLEPEAVNGASKGGRDRDTVCAVLRDVDGRNGTTTLSTWAGADFPAPLATGSSSAYVTPGSGQLYRQFKGEETKAGAVFLVTDTGLRYALQSNADGAGDDAGIGITKEERERLRNEARLAQIRLGYGDLDPAVIPAEWSAFLPTGPRLSTADARQPQGS